MASSNITTSSLGVATKPDSVKLEEKENRQVGFVTDAKMGKPLPPSPKKRRLLRHETSDGEPPLTPLTQLFRPNLDQATKYIVVSGGVCSSLGKGVTTSSIGALLRAEGFRVTAIKMDPYLNIDAGLMSPLEHGEVYVLDDGGETDLDLGNYERMMFVSLGRDNNITTGKIYDHVIKKERKGDYLGKTVQVVPHVTGAMVDWIDKVAQRPVDSTGLRPQICLIELGGTIGDIESMPFVEALRSFRCNLPEDSFAWCHCSYVPDMSGQKTKPTQHSVKALLALGVQPDLIVCRSKEPLAESTRKKIANQCNIRPTQILSAHDVTNLFHVPRILHSQNILERLTRTLHLEKLEPTQAALYVGDTGLRSHLDWNRFADQVDKAEKAAPVVVAFVGKYNEGGGDAYQSVLAALGHAAVAVTRKLKIEWIDACDLELPQAADEAVRARVAAAECRLRQADGIFVPGGFGDRGVEGKCRAAGLARQWKKPYLGVCLGMQVAIIQFARDMMGMQNATSEEFDKEKKKSDSHVLVYMPEISRETMGANMRLGTRWVEFVDPLKSLGAALYGGASRIQERHRHRFEFNIKYKERMEKKGLIFSAQDDSKERMDAVELPMSEHPFYFAVQYHPEYKSRPGQPSPPFFGFMAAASDPQSVSKMVQETRLKGPNAHWSPCQI